MNLGNLKDKTIIITRGVNDSIDSFLKLEEFGARIVHFPTLQYKPTDDWSTFDTAASKSNEIDFIIFTSTNTVIYFSRRCRETNIKWNFETTKVVAVGNKTAEECRKNKIPVSIIPEKFSVGGIIKVLSTFEIKNKKIFLPCSEIARKELPEKLNEQGAKVITTVIYKVGLPPRKIIEDNLQLLMSVKPDIFIFTSPSTFKNYLEIMKISEPIKYFDGLIIAAIGPATKEEIENHKITVNIVPQEHTIDGLVEEIKNYYINKN